MPALEEGNLWVRIRMPIDIRFEDAAALASRMRNMFMESPEVDTAVSQLGRPDDGTDPESFFNVEYYVNLKHRDEWRPGLWWRVGRRIGVGGMTPASQTKFMSEIIAAMIAQRDLKLDK